MKHFVASVKVMKLLFVEDGLVRFYSVTKRGGPIETPVLPWQPRKTSANKKFYFNIESAERGLIYRVKLKKNQNLFSRKVSQNLQNQDMNCLFSGTIVGEEQSTVGMNLCTGMVSQVSSFITNIKQEVGINVKFITSV